MICAFCDHVLYVLCTYAYIGTDILKAAIVVNFVTITVPKYSFASDMLLHVINTISEPGV